MTRAENPPAFPHDGSGPGGSLQDRTGMTLRDYFAAAALTGLCTDKELRQHEEECAERAYHMADAMLAARQGGGQ